MNFNEFLYLHELNSPTINYHYPEFILQHSFISGTAEKPLPRRHFITLNSLTPRRIIGISSYRANSACRRPSERQRESPRSTQFVRSLRPGPWLACRGARSTRDASRRFIVPLGWSIFAARVCSGWCLVYSDFVGIVRSGWLGGCFGMWQWNTSCMVRRWKLVFLGSKLKNGLKILQIRVFENFYINNIYRNSRSIVRIQTDLILLSSL